MMIGRGEGIHREEIDENISVENQLIGRHSGEGAASLKKRFQTRKNPRRLLMLCSPGAVLRKIAVRR